MRLEWAPLAEQDLNEITDYLVQESPQATIDQWDEIERQVELLLDHPHLGRTGRVRGTRELVINRTPYIAVYRATGSTITVLRVLHGAREWPQRS